MSRGHQARGCGKTVHLMATMALLTVCANTELDHEKPEDHQGKPVDGPSRLVRIQRQGEKLLPQAKHRVLHQPSKSLTGRSWYAPARMLPSRISKTSSSGCGGDTTTARHLEVTDKQLRMVRARLSAPTKTAMVRKLAAIGRDIHRGKGDDSVHGANPRHLTDHMNAMENASPDLGRSAALGVVIIDP